MTIPEPPPPHTMLFMGYVEFRAESAFTDDSHHHHTLEIERTQHIAAASTAKSRSTGTEPENHCTVYLAGLR